MVPPPRPGVVPPGLHERAALYRDQLADRRVLVVLDNAASQSQVRPLLPSDLGCAAVITSRAPLSGLAGAEPLPLMVLPLSEALQLLTRIAGPRRVGGEPEAARRIVELCGCLPLAVRVAGAKVAARPHWRLARLADRLDDERLRLDELRVGDLLRVPVSGRPDRLR